MKIGDLIRHVDDRRDQFYVVIEEGNNGLVKIKHTEIGWEHWLYTTTSPEQWEVVCGS
jgi:hypothetical protein